jgi:hypothetical protein
MVFGLVNLAAALQKKRSVVPRVCIQLLLPESQLNLDSLLSRYAAPTAGASLQPNTARSVSAAGATVSGTDGVASKRPAVCRSGTANELSDVLARIMLKASEKQHTISRSAADQPAVQAAAAAEADVHAADLSSSGSSSSTVSSKSYWQLFSSHVTVICVSEVKYSLMGQSCLACPGAVTLVSNLVHSVDSQALLHAQCEQAPMAVQEYLQGSTNELYEVRCWHLAAQAIVDNPRGCCIDAKLSIAAIRWNLMRSCTCLLLQVATLPAHLVGEPLSLLTIYLHELYQAVVIATAGSADAADSDSATFALPAPQAADSGTAQAASRGSSALSAGSELPSGSSARSIVLAPLQQTVTQQTSAFVIASDLRVVLDIMDAPAEEYAIWKLEHMTTAAAEAHIKAAQQQDKAIVQQAVQLSGNSCSSIGTPVVGTAASSPVKEMAQLRGDEIATVSELSPQQQQRQQAQHAGSTSMAAFSVECSDTSAASSIDHPRLQSPRIVADPAAAAVRESGAGGSPSQQDRGLATISATVSGSDRPAAAAGFGTGLRKSRRTAGDVEAGSGRMSAAAALVSTSAKSLLSIPASLASVSGPAAAAGLEGAAAPTAGRRRHTSRGSIQVNTRQRDFGGMHVHCLGGNPNTCSSHVCHAR